MEAEVKREMARQLQSKIDAMQGLGKRSERQQRNALSPFGSAFPGGVFPMAAIHEFISYEPSDAASTSGFMTALVGKFMQEGSLCLWIGNGTKIYPSGLGHFGLKPDRIVFIDAPTAKLALWIIEEALKCEALSAVVGEIKELGFTESRRLQLAVERSGVPGFIHRYRPQAENIVACTARWKITALPGNTVDGLPGMGHSCWDIQLLKVRNGKPDSWQVSWSGNNFAPIIEKHIVPQQERNVG
ncbi:Error-prone repair protein ImuA [Flavobacterium sp. MAH-1]|uniref:Error-prone repair protein ImuA n=1 Tax=Flavobacterium agri TaxID=2743471 RepID=A0A7Y8Y3P5_9FLAO|nr:Error-prone repair protein ImuA [Flavobacterium agri]NUY81927.1 Error-prone repair protein ImuA [Flavobacterium agri]NYA71951.1 Error-prone repair protein ImuA [Flavobacterium agri]